MMIIYIAGPYRGAYESEVWENMTPEERSRRYRARKRGEKIEKLRPGPKKGYKQTDDHILKRKRFGENHHSWLGEEVSEKGGRTRALRSFPEIGPCRVCGNKKSERHHIDGNPRNNFQENIISLCRRCHMAKDNRLEKLKELALLNQPKALAARWKR